MDQRAATDLLCSAQRTVGSAAIEALLPPPLFIMQINDHSTGRHINIGARAEGLPTIAVWRGSVWYSSRYLFNDERNPPGIKKGQEWADAPLQAFFAAVSAAHQKVIADREAAAVAAKARRIAEEASTANAYAALASTGAP